jgi:hypothetical protein
MTNIIPFKRPSPFVKHKGKTLCNSGFHKWKIKVDKQFDVKEGKLVTVLVCERCAQTKVETR